MRGRADVLDVLANFEIRGVSERTSQNHCHTDATSLLPPKTTPLSLKILTRIFASPIFFHWKIPTYSTLAWCCQKAIQGSQINCKWPWSSFISRKILHAVSLNENREKKIWKKYHRWIFGSMVWISNSLSRNKRIGNASRSESPFFLGIWV